MWYNGEVGTVTRLQEESEASCESEHGSFAFWIGQSERELKGAHCNAEEGEEDLLGPDGLRMLIEEICDEAASGAADHVEKAEHGGPLACLGLTHVGEVFGVEVAQDGVDGELCAKGAGVRDCDGGGGEAEEDIHGFFEGWGHDGVGAEGLELARRWSYGLGWGGVAFLFDVGDNVCYGGWAGWLAGRDARVNVDDVAVESAGFFGPEVAFRPFPCWGVFASEEHCYGYDDNDDKRHDISYSPGFVSWEALLVDEGVEDGRHDEAGE